MLKIVSLIASLFLSGCILIDSQDPFPVKKVLATDLQHSVYGEKSILVTSDNKLLFAQIQDVPLSVHDGAICVSPEDFLPLKHWIERHITSDQQGRK